MLLESFARFYEATFPSIHPGLREALRTAVRDHGDTWAHYFSVQIPANVMQGDVLGPLPFTFESDANELVERRALGMMVSQSCDFDEDRFALFAPAFPYADFAKQSNASSIRANEITTLFYLPPLVGSEPLVVDFRLMQPFSTGQIARKAAQGELVRERSFTDLGWYLLLAKLTLHFLRPQPEDDERSPETDVFSDRLQYALWQIPALTRYVFLPRS